MKKIIIKFFLILSLLLISLIITLSTVGIKTKKFNRLISDKASETTNVSLILNTIKFKINPKELSLFLETKNPQISFRDILIPVKNIKVYIDFFSLLKSDLKIKKANLSLKELNINQLNKIASIIKPSNFKSIINNKIKKGKLISEVDIFFNNRGEVENFITKGSIKNLEAELLSNINLKNIRLSFFADKNDILIKNIFGFLEEIEIADGDIKLNLEKGARINSNFNSIINFDEKILKKYVKIFKKNNLLSQVKDLKANLNNSLLVELDETYKVKNYDYNVSGKIEKSEIEFSKPLRNIFTSDDIKEVFLSDLGLQASFVPKKINLGLEGKYSLNKYDFLKFNLKNSLIGNQVNYKINFDYSDNLNLNVINFSKKDKSVANVLIDLSKIEENIAVNNFTFTEKNNSIVIKDLNFKNKNFSSFKQIEVKTENNDFIIKSGKKIIIKGSKFDATNLVKFLSEKKATNNFQSLNSKIEIDFKNILVPMSEKLKNFKLIGDIKKGQFVKISSKGDFGGNNYLDINMKKDKNSNKKYLEIYSDLTRPLLTEYSFFNGLSGGKLLFTSIIEDSKSNSKLKIENFKVINAPGLIKLLSLADLGGLADLAEGDGLSFDVLEINMEKDNKFLKLNEILALGPSMSVLMEGYQDQQGLTSLRGTLVPAKTLNKMISKIPVIGDIVIPKEVGEGLFGISFKMKGPKGKIKTTINPIRTLTPRFIQKIIDKNNKAK